MTSFLTLHSFNLKSNAVRASPLALIPSLFLAFTSSSASVATLKLSHMDSQLDFICDDMPASSPTSASLILDVNCDQLSHLDLESPSNIFVFSLNFSLNVFTKVSLASSCVFAIALLVRSRKSALTSLKRPSMELRVAIFEMNKITFVLTNKKKCNILRTICNYRMFSVCFLPLVNRLELSIHNSTRLTT